MKHKNVSIPEWLHAELTELKSSVELVGGQPMSLSRLLEVLVTHFLGTPPTPAWIKSVKFLSRGPGRPRKPKLASGPQVAVRKDQHDTSESSDGSTG